MNVKDATLALTINVSFLYDQQPKIQRSLIYYDRRRRKNEQKRFHEPKTLFFAKGASFLIVNVFMFSWSSVVVN